MSTTPEPTMTLEQNKRWLHLEACTCSCGWRSDGRLYGIHMGYSWRRLDTDPSCPEHAVSPSPSVAPEPDP